MDHWYLGPDLQVSSTCRRKRGNPSEASLHRSTNRNEGFIGTSHILYGALRDTADDI